MLDRNNEWRNEKRKKNIEYRVKRVWEEERRKRKERRKGNGERCWKEQAWDKRSSLFRHALSYEKKKFFNSDTWTRHSLPLSLLNEYAPSIIKLFAQVTHAWRK